MPKRKKSVLTKKGRFDNREKGGKEANFILDFLGIIYWLAYTIIFLVPAFFIIIIKTMKFIFRILSLPFRKK